MYVYMNHCAVHLKAEHPFSEMSSSLRPMSPRKFACFVSPEPLVIFRGRDMRTCTEAPASSS